MRERICPNCRTVLPIGKIYFDEKNNVICSICDKPIMAATPEAEEKIENKKTTTTRIGTYNTHQRHPSTNHSRPSNYAAFGYSGAGYDAYAD